MTKHIIGLIIFSFIVGTSAIIAGLFSYNPVPETYTLTTYKDSYKVYKKKKRKKRCRKRRPQPKEVSAEISQAVFDEKTNQLTTEISFKNYSDSNGQLNLYFFSKDVYGTQYLKQEKIYVTEERSVYRNSFDWLTRLEFKGNLYVIPVLQTDSDSVNWVKFDDSIAQPILIQKVK